MSMAIAQSVLEVIEEEKLQENAQAVGGYLLAQLRELAERHECVGNVRGQGLCVGVELVRERDTREPDREKAKEIVAKSVPLGCLSFSLSFFSPLSFQAAERPQDCSKS